eukprot:m.1061497 g.1061497  ORF g.1061497 m.1061497 type:complete len:62 (+) comp24212_c0_seq12:552-737(+)
MPKEASDFERCNCQHHILCGFDHQLSTISKQLRHKKFHAEPLLRVLCVFLKGYCCFGNVVD